MGDELNDPVECHSGFEYAERPTLDPYAVSGAVSMALFEELMATASIVGQP